MKIIVIVILNLLFVPGRFKSEDSKVYICVSGSAHVYHSTRDCRGLNNCTHEIRKTTLDSAVNYYERRACKECE